MRNSYCFIDAFNVFHYAIQKNYCTDSFQSITLLIASIEKFAAYRGCQAFVVFDGSRYQDQFVSTQWTKIITTVPPESADDRIEFMLESNRDLAHCSVVTDDRTLGNMAVGYGASWISAKSWFIELKSFLEQESTAKKDDLTQSKFFNTPFRNHPDFQ